MNTIGTKIRKLREQNNLSQQDLAFIIETSQGNLCKIESGQTEKLDFLLMHKICEHFNVDSSYFIEPSQNINVNKNKSVNGVITGNCRDITINNEKKDKNKDIEVKD
jgi:transcriptional regulator with XRE-family HTH domain